MALEILSKTLRKRKFEIKKNFLYPLNQIETFWMKKAGHKILFLLKFSSTKFDLVSNWKFLNEKCRVKILFLGLLTQNDREETATSNIAAESHTENDDEMATSNIAAESHTQNDEETATSNIAAESHTENDEETATSNIAAESHTQNDEETATSKIAAESHTQNDEETATSNIAAESHTENDEETATSNIAAESHTENDEETATSNIAAESHTQNDREETATSNNIDDTGKWKIWEKRKKRTFFILWIKLKLSDWKRQATKFYSFSNFPKRNSI